MGKTSLYQFRAPQPSEGDRSEVGGQQNRFSTSNSRASDRWLFLDVHNHKYLYRSQHLKLFGRIFPAWPQGMKASYLFMYLDMKSLYLGGISLLLIFFSILVSPAERNTVFLLSAGEIRTMLCTESYDWKMMRRPGMLLCANASVLYWQLYTQVWCPTCLPGTVWSFLCSLQGCFMLVGWKLCAQIRLLWCGSKWSHHISP